METKELTTHQRGVILRGICGGAALKDKSPQISENNTVITCAGGLEIWDICCISSDAEAFGLKPSSVMTGTRESLSPPKNKRNEIILLLGLPAP